ncbi:hypothetical protein [Aeromicrobium sp.]|uniref:hypothetical protein n=1 Tax=Aeromicrobium sp. TaxID=1871063 RepID=UPI003C469A46
MKRSVAVLFSVLVALCSTAAPAAATGELGISHDGVAFAPTFHGPLFDSATRWVPGDSRHATFYVRNQGGTPARMSVDLLGDHVGDLLDSGDLTVTASAGGTSGSTTSDRQRRLITLTEVAADEVVPVVVSIDFAFSSPNDTQLRSTDLSFRINLSQTSAVLDDGDGRPNGPLPDTGGLPLWIFAFGSILLGTGVAIVSRPRTSPQGASHV